MNLYEDKLINCDVGEGYDDEKIMPYIQLANIACEGHAGDTSSMQNTITLAQKYGVKIGAHPSYPDRENFGRMPNNISLKDLKLSLEKQVNSLSSLQQPLHHIKAHGALYHAQTQDKTVFKILLNIAQQHQAVLLVPSNLSAEFIALAKKQKVNLLFEAFADRAYLANGNLAPRTQTDSVYTSPDKIIKQARTIKNGQIKLGDKTYLKIYADTICLHGDNPASVKAAQFL